MRNSYTFDVFFKKNISSFSVNKYILKKILKKLKIKKKYIKKILFFFLPVMSTRRELNK